MLGHLPSGFLGGNKVMELQPFNRHKVKHVRTHIYNTHTHTAECTKAVKATTPSARCYPRLEGVSVRSLSHLCYSGRQVSVTPHRAAKNPHSINLSTTIFPVASPFNFVTRSFNCYGLLEGIIMKKKKIYFHCALTSV